MMHWISPYTDPPRHVLFNLDLTVLATRAGNSLNPPEEESGGKMYKLIETDRIRHMGGRSNTNFASAKKHSKGIFT